MSDAKRIKELLLERVAGVAQHLFPNGRREGKHWRAGSIDGEAGKSFDICIKGANAGYFGDWAREGKHSRNLIDLWMQVRNVDFKTALHEAADWLGVSLQSENKSKKLGFATLDEAVGFIVRKLKMIPTRRDWYHDENGNEHFVMVRFDGRGKKEFRPFHRNADGRWIIGDPPGKLPLFNLPKLLAPDLNPSSEPVFLVEGEKCVCRLEPLGFLVTTSAHGAKGARVTDWEPLAGRFVVILPDNDESGQTYEDTSASFLMQLSPRAMVKVVRLPGLPEKGDIEDWLDARDGKPTEETKAELLELVKNAKAAREPQKQSTEAKSTTEEKRFFKPKPIPWEELEKAPDLSSSLLENRALERGQGGLLFGPSGCGKSTLGFQLCCCWSTGMAGAHIAPVKPLRIAILQTEDSVNDLREYREGVLSQKCFTPEKIALVKRNLIVLEPVPGGPPDYLRALLNDVAERFEPDLISLNPLLAFCAADYVKELGSILYTVIDPVIKKHHIGFWGVHHTPKPFHNKAPGNYGAYDFQYLAAGDARIANWPRLSLQIEPISANPVLTACFRIAKRWQRIAWLNDHNEPTRERFLKHSPDKIWWTDATQDEANSSRENEEPRKILDILPGPSEPGIIREEVHVRAKNKFNIGKRKADDWLKIELHADMIDRAEILTEGNRKSATFRRVYE
jgi:hypothetical protein